MRTLKHTSFVFLLLATSYLLFTTPASAQSSIFEGWQSPPGLFEGLRQGLQGLFGGEKPAETGGARIPIEPISALPTPPPTAPPSPDSADYLKLTLAWEALSTGQEKYLAGDKDPLEKEHLAQIHCPCGPPSGEPGGAGCSLGEIKHVLYGWCGQDPIYTPEIPVPPDLPWCEDLPADRDPAQRCIPKNPAGPNSDTLQNAISNKYIRRDGYLFTCIGAPICPAPLIPLRDTPMLPPEFPTREPRPTWNPPAQPPERPPREPTEPRGGQPPYLPTDIPEPSPTPETPTNAPPGPPENPPQETLVPQPTPVVTWNYIEFQTEIYHSNNLNLYLNVENQSTHPLENIEIAFHPQLFTDEDLKQSLTHNLDYPIAAQPGAGWSDPNSGIVFPAVTYQHAHRLDAFSKTYLDGNTLENLPPFEIGPFDLAAKEKKVFPLQDEKAGYCNVPTAQKPTTSTSSQSLKTESLGWASSGSDPDLACKCSRVEMHNFWQSDPPLDLCGQFFCRDCPDGCPTIYACRTYYGIGYPEYTDQQGVVCDNNCITVPGCPPPSCFNPRNGSVIGASCRIGPRPGDPECNFDPNGGNRTSGWTGPRYYDCPAHPEDSFVHLQGLVTPTPTPALVSKMTREINFLSPQEAQAYGCGSECRFIQPTPTPTPAPSCYSLVPRDFNFVCDTKDDNTGEIARCSDDKSSGIYPLPTDESGNPDSRFLEFRDVTTMGGCGYKASSNDSVMGPLIFEAKYGKTQESRSVLLSSIPIGGKQVDFEGSPVGWPASGKISEDWGATQTAQELGPFDKFTPGMSNEIGDDYLFCPNQGQTYPPRTDGSTAPIGDYLHPGIDIVPTYEEETDINVYSTQAGWITFAGTDPKSPKSGWSVQVESDVTQDNKPDYVTRYDHLLQNSIQVDTQDLDNLLSVDGSRKPFGNGVYIPRNALLGKMGDSGSPGQTQLHYEIIGQENIIDPKSSTSTSGDITQSVCTSNPYIGFCAADGSEGFYFSKLKFYTPDGNPVKGPIYKNP